MKDANVKYVPLTSEAGYSLDTETNKDGTGVKWGPAPARKRGKRTRDSSASNHATSPDTAGTGSSGVSVPRLVVEDATSGVESGMGECGDEDASK